MNNHPVNRPNTPWLTPGQLLDAISSETLQVESPARSPSAREMYKIEEMARVSKSAEKLFEESIHAMDIMMEIRDPYTSSHQKRVARLSVDIAKVMALPADRIKGIQMGALVHDIGKLAIPPEIINKPGRLTPGEYEVIKTHTSIGHRIVKDISFSWPVAKMVLQHHERMNGTGYPMGLKKDEILLESRILAVADVVEAMSANRPYRPALDIKITIEEITNNKYNLYDPNVVEACLQVLASKEYNLNDTLPKWDQA
jgi:putative nucleotidyltransferase with HDIG domain